MRCSTQFWHCLPQSTVGPRVGRDVGPRVGLAVGLRLLGERVGASLLLVPFADRAARPPVPFAALVPFVPFMAFVVLVAPVVFAAASGGGGASSSSSSSIGSSVGGGGARRCVPVRRRGMPVAGATRFVLIRQVHNQRVAATPGSAA